MKRLTKLVLLLVLAAILCPILAGCALGASDTSNEPSIAYGEKYVYKNENETTNERSYYVFNKDCTGYYQRGYHYHSEIGGNTYTYIYSGRADFIWRAADDGSVYLFQTKVTYDEDDTSKTWGVGELPLSFADEFVIVMNSNGTVTRFVLEGSDLEKSLEK